MDKLIKIIETGMSCLIPVYQQDIGNGTKLIAKDGTSYVDSRTIKTVLKILCQHYTLHIEAYRAKYGKMVNQRLGVPIFMHPQLMLVPMKMRKPLFAKDGAYGYVNLYAIKHIKEKDHHTSIILQNGMEIMCLHRMRTVQQHLNRAKVIAANHIHYTQNHNPEDTFREFYAQYNSPATKADIAHLQREILALRDVLKKVIVYKENDKG
ncbi:hypothetical protein QBE52_03050 [Clostridiaceae bacterium 35-E11]